MAGRGTGFQLLHIRKTVQHPGLGKTRVKAQVFYPSVHKNRRWPRGVYRVSVLRTRQAL